MPYISAFKPVTMVTMEPHLLLNDLYPGASYQIKVFAISHGLRSEPHDYFQTVCKDTFLYICNFCFLNFLSNINKYFILDPRPPYNLTLENVTSNSVVVRWKEPDDSIYTEYSIR